MENFNRYSKNAYKNKYTLEERLIQSNYVLDKYPTSVPIIVEYSDDFPSDYRTLYKQKYLIPTSYKLVDFLSVIRKHINLPARKSMCLMSDNGILLRPTDSFELIYPKHKHKDNFLYICILIESTFG